MLHVFDSATGDEIFGYIPNLVFNSLKNLAVPNPNYDHTYFVDGPPYIKDVGSKTYLVGGLGKGGKGYYFLDMTGIDASTDAETSAASIVKWEFPNAGSDGVDNDGDAVADEAGEEDPDMGYSFSRPFIVDSNSVNGEWLVIFGNGYESTNQRAVLYVLGFDKDTGSLNWTKKISTGPSNEGTTTACNGLSTPVLIDTDFDGKVDYAYAGDLLGNLWKFDLTHTNKDNWGVFYNTSADGTGDPKPLFTAKYDDGVHATSIQPITTKPDVIYHCSNDRLGYLVIFGTGRYLKADEYSDVSVQSLYAIWDWSDAWVNAGEDPVDKYLGERSADEYLSNLAGNASMPEGLRTATLLRQVQVTGDSHGAYRVLSDYEINWYDPDDDQDNRHVGWVFDLPATSERIITNLMIRDGIVVFISAIPSDSPCAAGGSSIIHGINACNGGRLNDDYYDVNGDGKLSKDDEINIGSLAKPNWLDPSGIKKLGMYYTPAILSIKNSDTAVGYFSKSDGSIDAVPLLDEVKGMFSWREIEGN